MAHLQPPASAATHQIRLTSVRGFMPEAARLSGRQVRELWVARGREVGADAPYWLYTHIPFCPQICTFCQCSTSLRKSDEQVESYLDWLEGEIEFFSDAVSSRLVKIQYLGGGTPNLLSDVQLDRLLAALNRSFRFNDESRRTFEFLPSSLRPETLPLARSYGFNRISCGVQSWNGKTLDAVNRARAGLDRLGETIESAYAVGYDECNLDMIFGIGGESEAEFLDSLLHVLAVRPTTVTIHRVIPTATNPVYASVEDELAAHVAFENLERAIGAAVAERFPDMVWILRPNSWILVERAFFAGRNFGYWYYSDNERFHIDILGLGRFAHSDIIGSVNYENVSKAARYDPDEASYHAFRKTPSVDAALDLISDLVGDRRTDLRRVEERHGAAAVAPLRPVLARLGEQGRVAQRDESWETLQTDGVFIDPFWPLLEAALPVLSGPAAVPRDRGTDKAIRIGRGDDSLLVFVEKRAAERRYYAEIDRFGIYYRDPSPGRAAEQQGWIEDAMRGFVDHVRRLLAEAPGISAYEVKLRLRDLYPDG